MEKAPRKYVRKKKAAPALLSDSGLSLTELKTRSMQALMELAEQYEIENASSMRKQELIFALLQACASQNGAIYGDGVPPVSYTHLDVYKRQQQAQPYYTEVLRAVPEAADVHEAYARSLGSIGKTGLAYIHMAYSAIYSNNRKLAERYFKQAKAKTEKSADSAAFRKLDAVYKERKEIWEDR